MNLLVIKTRAYVSSILVLMGLQAVLAIEPIINELHGEASPSDATLILDDGIGMLFFFLDGSEVLFQ
jgi:hypothetical protein